MDAHAIEAEIKRLEHLAAKMDSAFRVPGTQIRLGYDALLGLIPGVGDALALAPAGYILWKARNLGVSSTTLVRMAGNIGIDTLIGSIPLLGDIFDVGFKANRRNVALLRRHMEGAGRPLDAKRPHNSAAPSTMSNV